MPTLLDGFIMAGLGLVWAGWTYFIARAYSLAQASVAAPFEYLSLPVNMMWGLIIFQEVANADDAGRRLTDSIERNVYFISGSKGTPEGSRTGMNQRGPEYRLDINKLDLRKISWNTHD